MNQRELDCLNSIYEPSEDSYLLLKHVEKQVNGSVLDMGTGSGIQGVAAALKPEVEYVLATDINPKAIEAARKRAVRVGVVSKMRFLVSDLFTNIEGRFDWIIFNPPYLPSERGIEDSTWDGGEKGGEIIERFLEEATCHLTPKGSILMIVSSETGFNQNFHNYRWNLLEEKHFFFETLYCVCLNQS